MRRILAIDDDRLVLKSVDKILKKEGFETELSCRADEAIEKALKSILTL